MKKAMAQAPAKEPTTIPAIAPPDTPEDDDGNAVDCTPAVVAGCVDDEDGGIVALDPAGNRAAERIA